MFGGFFLNNVKLWWIFISAYAEEKSKGKFLLKKWGKLVKEMVTE